MYLLPRSTYSPDEHAFNADIVSSAGVFYILSIALTLSLVVAFALVYGAQNWVEGVTVTAAITINIVVCSLQDCLSFGHIAIPGPGSSLGT